jgi:hypothetical protein
MFKNHARKVASVLGIALLLAIFLPKLALADDDGDPPSVVARLSLAEGPVSFEPGGTDDWVDAVINRPVTTGDKLWSDDGGRAELQLDASTIRLSRNTGFSFLNLDDNITQIRLTEGTLLVRVRFLENDETYEVDTPNLAFSITRPGIYRINVNEGGDSTRIIVRNGEGQVTGGGASYSVRTNDDAVFSGGDQLDADVQDYSNDDDDFDAWSAQRDRHYEHSRSSQYVSADVVGYQDLDDHGDWADAPEYGHVWYPRVEVGWAPYHVGHWAYIAPWGYTWVDDQPWGFAPFHYGRWVNVEGRWGWIPSAPRVVGVAYVRPVYAPALVAFVGGGGFAVGVGVGGGAAVGWFPLGPREVYVPSYHVSPRYVERVNISNTTVNRTVVNNYYNTTVINKTTVNNVTYVNQRVPGAMVATSQQAFTSAQPVSRNVVRVNQQQMAAAQVTYRAPAVVPTRQAVLGSGQAAAHQPPAALASRPVVARATPPPPPPSFEARAQAIKANGGQPISMQQARQIQPAPAARAQVAAVRVAPPPRQPAVSVRQAPKPAQPANRAPVPGNVAGRPGQPVAQPQAAPANRPANAPAPAAVGPNNRPATATPQPATPAPANRPPAAAQPAPAPVNRAVTQPNAAQPNNRPPATAQPTPAPANRPADRPPTAQPNNRPAEPPAAKPAPAPAPLARPADRPAERPAERPAPRPTPEQQRQQEKQQQKEKEKPQKEKEKDKDKDKPKN